MKKDGLSSIDSLMSLIISWLCWFTIGGVVGYLIRKAVE